MPIRSAILGIVLLATGCHSAGEVHFPPRPRIAYSVAELAAFRSDPARETERQRIIARADQLLKEGLTVPQQEGNWIFYYACPDDGSRLRPQSLTEHTCPKCGKSYSDERTNAAYRTQLYNQLERHMYELAMAYALSGEEAYVGPVRDAFLELARLYPTFTRHDRWGRTGLLAVVGGRRYAQHLDEAYSAITLARAYDLCADATLFTTADRETIEQEFLGRTVREIRQWQWAIEAINNHQTWFNAAYANVGLAIGDEELLRAAIHAEGRGLLWQLEHSVTEDGIWYEGTMAYHFYALQAIMRTLEPAARIGWTFETSQKLRSLWLGPLQMAYPDGSFPVINDSDPGSLQGRGEFYAFARRYFDDPIFDAFAAGGGLQSAALKGVGLAVLRRGSAENPLALFADYGIHGGHHGHPDKLNITLYAFNREIVLDPGRLTYSVPEYTTWARTTVAHNTVVINGENQQPDTGDLLWFGAGEAVDACLIRSTGAYPGYELRRWLVLSDHWLADVYTVRGEQEARLDWLLHVRGEALPGGEAIASVGEGAGYQHLSELRDHGSATTFAFQLPKGPALRVACWPALPAYSGLGIGYRIGSREPFLLRRATGKAATFVTLYDLTDERQVDLGEVVEADDVLRLRIMSDGNASTLQLSLIGDSGPTLTAEP